jgi:multidrug efflux pump subunit AcrA (membrane-fusion protein)
VVAGVLVVAAAGTSGVLVATGVVGGHDPAKNPSPDSAAATSTAVVTRQTLSERTSVNGTLGYARTFHVIGHANGTITGLPSVGDIISQGHVLYRVNGDPVVLLQGSRVPMYRALSETMEGRDVRQLNANLVALGYASRDELDPKSDYFGSATAAALKKLQKKVGLSETGRLDLGQAVFVGSPKIRIVKLIGVYGASARPGGEIVQASSTTRYVKISLDASLQSQVKAGDKVIVTMPDNRKTPGKVSSVGSVAVPASSGSTVEVDVRLSHPKATGRLDQAPVTVSIVSQSMNNVLAVPVNALLAQPGGYSVEVVEADGAHHLVPVTIGLFDDDAGLVQVTGTGLAAGQRVVVPAS